MSPDPNIIEKIKKLLRMADVTRGATVNEAEVAFAKAQELMVEHGINLAHVKDDDGAVPVQFAVGEATVQMGRRQFDFDHNVAAVLQKVLDIQVLFTKYADRDKKGNWCHRHAYILVGGETDREYAKLLIEMLVSAMTLGLSRHLRERGEKWNASSAKSYYLGVQKGFIAAAESGRNKAVAAAPETARNAYALAVVDKRASIKLWMDNNMKVTEGRKRRKYDFDPNAYANGFAKGQSLDIGNKKMGPGATHKLGQ